MENSYFETNELDDKIRSKKDLYDLFKFDCNKINQIADLLVPKLIKILIIPNNLIAITPLDL